MTDICCGISMVLLNLRLIFPILLKVSHMENGIEIFEQEQYKDKAEKYHVSDNFHSNIYNLHVEKNKMYEYEY